MTYGLMVCKYWLYFIFNLFAYIPYKNYQKQLAWNPFLPKELALSSNWKENYNF